MAVKAALRYYESRKEWYSLPLLEYLLDAGLWKFSLNLSFLKKNVETKCDFNSNIKIGTLYI